VIPKINGSSEAQGSYVYRIPETAPLKDHVIMVSVGDSNRTALLHVTERMAERTFMITLESLTDVIGLHEAVTISAHVWFLGPEDAPNVTVILTEDKIPRLGEENLGAFVPGQSKIAYFDYKGEAPGIHSLTAYIAETGESNQLLITVMPTPATSLKVELIEPVNNSVVSSLVTVKAYAKVPFGETVSKVELYLDGLLFGSMSSTEVIGQYNLEIDTTVLDDGLHMLKAVLTTTSAMSTHSHVLHMTIKNKADPPPPPPPQKYETTVNEGQWASLLFLVLLMLAVISIILYRGLRG
jgi:hypothetical protein